MKKRFFNQKNLAESKPPILHQDSHQTQILDTKQTTLDQQYSISPKLIELEAIPSLLRKIDEQTLIAFHLDFLPQQTLPHGFSLAWEETSCLYCPLSKLPLNQNQLDLLTSVLDSPHPKTFYHLKSQIDHLSLRPHFRHQDFCCYIAYRLTNNHLISSLESISQHLITPLPTFDSLSQTFPNDTPPLQGDLFASNSPDIASAQAHHACIHALAILKLTPLIQLQLQQKKQTELFQTLELPIVTTLINMQNQGIKVNANVLDQLGQELQQNIDQTAREIHQTAGETFNISSPKALGKILFSKLHLLKKPSKTKTGQFVTNESVLSKLQDKHPIIPQILKYREYTKLNSTYILGLKNHIDPQSQLIHTQFHSLETATGRLSSDQPNLQNIPVRTPEGRKIRCAFTSNSPQFNLFCADYSQIELRIIAALSQDHQMIQDFQDQQDIHSATAGRIFNLPPSNILPEMRRVAKMVNFGIIYGISPFGLSSRLKIPRNEASQIIDTYFQKYPSIKTFMDQTIETAKNQGYIQTLLGRRRYIPEINSANATVQQHAQRAAINTPIQGSSADMIKLAMLKVQQLNEHYQSRLCLQVHDELVFQLHLDEQESFPAQVHQKMTHALKLPAGVPIEVDMKTGENWLELSPIKLA